MILIILIQRKIVTQGTYDPYLKSSFALFEFRGFPVWLKFVPGISFRTDNEPFKVEFLFFQLGSLIFHI